MGEDDGKEGAALTGAFAFLVEACCGGATVVAVGDVKCGDAGEGFFNERDVAGGIDIPGGVADAVRSGEVDVGRGGGLFAHEVVHGGVGAIGEECGAGLGIEGFDVAEAVFFFVDAGEFVFFDASIDVFLATGGGDKAGLGVLAHGLAVEVEGGGGVLAEVAGGDEFLEIFFAFGVNGGVVEVDGSGEIDFGFADVEEAEGVGGGEVAGFGGGKHVVGRLAYASGEVGQGTQCCEWF